MNHIHPSKIYSENPKKLNQSFNAFQMSFRKTDQMAALMAKLKQVFKVENLNPQKEETTKSLLHLIKLNNKYTYWYYFSRREHNNCKKARISITFHNNRC